MIFRKITTFLFVIFLLPSCDKKNVTPIEVLPNAHNSTNQRVFGCLINGEVWTPKSRGIFSPIDFSYSPSSGYFFIVAERFDEPVGNMLFHCSFQEKGKHPLDFASYEGSSCEYEYIDDENNPSNFVEIDSLERIGAANHIVIIGRFQFTAIDTVCQDTVRITDGRFKVTTS